MKLVRTAPFNKRGLLAMRADLWGSMFSVSERDRPFEVVGNAAVVTISGPLTQHAEWFWDSYDAIADRVGAALESSAKVVVLKIDSPGGDVAGCFETAHAIRERAKATGKRIVAYADGMAASAGYALACIAEEIALPATGFVGSIGCISTLVDQVAANERYGLNFAVVASGGKKTFGNPNVPISEAAIANTKKDVDALARLFFDLVAESRGIDVQGVAALDAGMLLGAEALAAGLADRVCTFDEFLEAIASEETTSAPRAAAKKEKAMAGWKEEMKKAAAEGDEDAKKALEAMGGDDEPGAEDEKEKPAAEGEKEPDGDEAPNKKEQDDEKAAARVSVSDRIRAIEEKEERRELLAKRPDFANDPALSKRMATAPLAAVRWNVENLPRIAAKAATPAAAPAPSQTSPLAHAGAVTPGVTRSEGEGDGYRGVTRKSEHADKLDQVLGFTKNREFVIDEKNKRVIRLMTPAQAREHQKKIQARAAEGGGK